MAYYTPDWGARKTLTHPLSGRIGHPIYYFGAGPEGVLPSGNPAGGLP
jgi:hypothetical protein